ncbi:MAG: cytochrome B [Pseudarcicella sp.]|nr:cytochrome B [Pseudarcicella sp.]MBP6410087.1 cytochrome B [Pseudarcicella sp.]
MYEILKAIHSYTRWAVIILAIVVLAKAVQGITQKKAFTESDRKAGLFFMIICHIQLTIGMVLYFHYSPLGLQAFGLGMKEVMKTAVYRKIAVEHITGMIIALVLITMGYSKNKRSTIDTQRHKNALTFYGIGLLLIIATIPWDRLF